MSPGARVLVRAPNWIGDAVLSLGALRDVRRNFPTARIEILARPWVADVYRAVTQIDGVREARGFREGAALIRGAFDTAILLPNSFGAALQVLLARVPERWGYATDGRALLLTRRARVPPEVRGVSEALYYRALLAGLGLVVSDSPDVSLGCPAAWRERGALRLSEGAPWFGLNPGAAFGSAKRWLPERFAEVADRVARSYGWRCLIVGGAGERALAEAIAGRMTTPARVLCGETTLAELIGVLAHLKALLSNDSGPMHLAAALGRPVVAVFGPTDWRETAPLGRATRVVREPVDCAPCKLRECPTDHRCMSRVSSERVFSALQELLAEGDSR
jgi:heptosyltransferase-2